MRSLIPFRNESGSGRIRYHLHRALALTLLMLFQSILITTLGQPQRIDLDGLPKREIDGKEYYVYTVPTGQTTSLEEIAERGGLEFELLRETNPELVNRRLRARTEVYYPVRKTLGHHQLQANLQNLQVQPQFQTDYEKLYNTRQTIKYRDISGDMVTRQQSPKDFKLAEGQNFASFEAPELLRTLDMAVLPENAGYNEVIIRAKTADNKEADIIPLFVSKVPIGFDPGEGAWKTSLEVILKEIKDGKFTDVQKQLASPIIYKVYAAEVPVDQFEVEFINKDIPVRELRLSPGEVRVPQSESNTVSLGLREMNTDTWVRDERPVEPFIRITPHKRSLQGYGVETTLLDVELLGVKEHEPVTVSLRAEHGSLDPQRVTFASDEKIKTVELRSKGSGSDLVMVTSDIPSSPGEVDYIFPWMFIIFALLGGVIGTLIRMLSRGRKGFNVRSFISGVLTGFIVALAYWAIGLNLLSFSLDFDYFNEAAVLVLSALGGVAGSSIFKPAGTS